MEPEATRVVGERRTWEVAATAAVTGGQALVHFGHGDGEVALKVAMEPADAGAWLDEERALLEQLAALPGLADRVVAVVDHGVWGARRWYAMPRYPDTLASWIGHGPPMADRLAAALAVVDAVRALHAAGGADARFVHRDVKPTNVMRRADGAWLLADFGAARAVSAAGASVTTRAFHSRGFAPPEQGLPGAARPDPAWDVFACAATAYFCATGRPAAAPAANGLCLTTLGRRAVAGLDVGEAGADQLLAYGRMRALDDADRAALRGAVGDALADTIEAMLAPEPSRRRGDLSALAAALQAEIRTPMQRRRSRRWRGVGALALVLGVVAGWLAMSRPAAEGPERRCPPDLAPGPEGCRSPDGLVLRPVAPGLGDAPNVRLDHALLVGADVLDQASWVALTGESPMRTARVRAGGGIHGECASDPARVGDALPVGCVSPIRVVRLANQLSERAGLAPAYVVHGDDVVRVVGAPGYRLPTAAEWRYLDAVGGPADRRDLDPARAGGWGGPMAEIVDLGAPGAVTWAAFGGPYATPAPLRADAMGATLGVRLVRDGLDAGALPARIVGPGLWVAQTELTRAQWRRRLGDPPTDGCGTGPDAANDDLPVTCVSFRDAVAFANAQSAAEGRRPAYTTAGDGITWDRAADGWRLPTVAEWRRAAGDHRFPGTDDPGALCARGNLPLRPAGLGFGCVGARAALAPVASAPPTAGPIYDLLGNVAEWAWDVEERDLRAVVGVAWAPIVDDVNAAFVLDEIETDHTYAFDPGLRSRRIGIRLVRDAR